MKKFILLLTAVIFTACTAVQPPVQDSKNYTFLTQYTRNFTFTEDGAYEAMRHMDNSVDILYIDIASGTRTVKGDMTIAPAQTNGYTNLISFNDCVYFFGCSSRNEDPSETESDVLYKFSEDGKLIKKHSFDRLFRPAIGRFVHDGKDLYFRAARYVQNENELIPDMGLYRLDTDTFETERLCDAPFQIIGAWKNQLIVNVNVVHGDDYISYLESIDMTTYEHTRLAEAGRYPWFFAKGKLYNHYLVPGSLVIYDIDTGQLSEIKIFENDPADLKNYRAEYHHSDSNILYVASHTENFTESRHMYNTDTGEIIPVNMEGFIYGKAGDYYLVTIGQQTIYIGKALYERADNVYAFVKCEDYINGNPRFRYISSSIDYR